MWEIFLSVFLDQNDVASAQGELQNDDGAHSPLHGDADDVSQAQSAEDQDFDQGKSFGDVRTSFTT